MALCPDIVDDLEGGCPRTLSWHEHSGISVRSPLLGLRREQQLSPSRLKVWRKRARDGTLPPVLALRISPLCAYVVLDGHHRWRAALDEQFPVPVLSLTHLHAPQVSVREQAHLLVDQLRRRGEMTFRALTADAPDLMTKVARFLAVLELFREGAISFEQATPLGDLHVRWTGSDEGDIDVGDEFDESDGVDDEAVLIPEHLVDDEPDTTSHDTTPDDTESDDD